MLTASATRSALVGKWCTCAPRGDARLGERHAGRDAGIAESTTRSIVASSERGRSRRGAPPACGGCWPLRSSLTVWKLALEKETVKSVCFCPCVPRRPLISRAGGVPGRGAELGSTRHARGAAAREDGMHGSTTPGPYRAWQRKLADAGLVGVTWPKEYGGGGLGPIEQVIVNAELRAAGCAAIVDHIAIGELGPTIIAYGTDEQKERYLGPMLRGDEGWCQLFSEPAAGSDLAGIVTRARARRRTAGRQRPEGLDDDGPVRRLRAAARAHRPRRAQAQGPVDVHRRHARAGRHGPAAAADLAAPPTSTRSSSTTSRCRTRTRSSGPGTAAGASR